MSKGIGFRIKQYIKMFIQNKYLPAIYRKAVRNTKVDRNTVIIADMHSDSIPYSMKAVYDRLKADGKRVLVYCRDMNNMSYRELVSYLKSFMKDYAAAGYVFICSYFLPVSSCEKREETKVIQLWHSGGLLKKMGYDTPDDIPEYYKGNVTRNYDLVTVSSEICVPVWEKALHLPKRVTRATGLARTDVYFDDDWNIEKRELFYKLYPGAKGKRVVLYAPSFTGNAANPRCRGLKSVRKVFESLDDNYFLIIRLHPNLRKKYPKYWNDKTRQMPAEDLLPVTSVLITDYSSILFDYSLYRKPFILFCPDIEEFEKTRGFYVDPETFPAPLARTEEELEVALRERKYFDYSEQDYEQFYEKYMGSCKGDSINKILSAV